MLRKNNRGITLIALVVTIIVLLILAGISISMLTGQNGILNRASEAKEKTETSSVDEKRKLAQAEALMNTERTTYKGVTLPEGFAPTKIDGEDSIDEGLVITDGYGNEYVWVEVPKTGEVYKNAGLEITEFSDEEYGKIESDLKEYTKVYRSGTIFEDEYVADNVNQGWFNDKKEYDDAKYKMLKSIYKNKGFWVARYEAGIEKNRISSGSAEEIPISKPNVYTYNYVGRTQAKVLAEKVESGSYTSSLMFGVQWDLILAFMHNKGNIDNSLLVQDSKNIGNYANNLWSITNEKSKYSKDNGMNYYGAVYKKDNSENILLTTGADKSFSEMNIFDMAGNVLEWTLEKAYEDSSTCSYRGGMFEVDGNFNPMANRSSDYVTSSSYCIGFRVSMY